MDTDVTSIILNKLDKIDSRQEEFIKSTTENTTNIANDARRIEVLEKTTHDPEKCLTKSKTDTIWKILWIIITVVTTSIAAGVWQLIVQGQAVEKALHVFK